MANGVNDKLAKYISMPSYEWARTANRKGLTTKEQETINAARKTQNKTDDQRIVDTYNNYLVSQGKKPIENLTAKLATKYYGMALKRENPEMWAQINKIKSPGFVEGSGGKEAYRAGKEGDFAQRFVRDLALGKTPEQAFENIQGAYANQASVVKKAASDIGARKGGAFGSTFLAGLNPLGEKWIKPEHYGITSALSNMALMGAVNPGGALSSSMNISPQLGGALAGNTMNVLQGGDVNLPSLAGAAVGGGDVGNMLGDFGNFMNQNPLAVNALQYGLTGQIPGSVFGNLPGDVGELFQQNPWAANLGGMAANQALMQQNQPTYQAPAGQQRQATQAQGQQAAGGQGILPMPGQGDGGDIMGILQLLQSMGLDLGGLLGGGGGTEGGNVGGTLGDILGGNWEDIIGGLGGNIGDVLGGGKMDDYLRDYGIPIGLGYLARQQQQPWEQQFEAGLQGMTGAANQLSGQYNDYFGGGWDWSDPTQLAAQGAQGGAGQPISPQMGGTPPGPVTPGIDINQLMAQIKANFGQTGQGLPGDINADGTVNTMDLAAARQQGAGQTPTTGLPYQPNIPAVNPPGQYEPTQAGIDPYQQMVQMLSYGMMNPLGSAEAQGRLGTMYDQQAGEVSRAIENARQVAASRGQNPNPAQNPALAQEIQQIEETAGLQRQGQQREMFGYGQDLQRGYMGQLQSALQPIMQMPGQAASIYGATLDPIQQYMESIGQQWGGLGEAIASRGEQQDPVQMAFDLMQMMGMGGQGGTTQPGTPAPVAGQPGQPGGDQAWLTDLIGQIFGGGGQGGGQDYGDMFGGGGGGEGLFGGQFDYGQGGLDFNYGGTPGLDFNYGGGGGLDLNAPNYGGLFEPNFTQPSTDWTFGGTTPSGIDDIWGGGQYPAPAYTPNVSSYSNQQLVNPYGLMTGQPKKISSTATKNKWFV